MERWRFGVGQTASPRSPSPRPHRGTQPGTGGRAPPRPPAPTLGWSSSARCQSAGCRSAWRHGSRCQRFQQTLRGGLLVDARRFTSLLVLGTDRREQRATARAVCNCAALIAHSRRDAVMAVDFARRAWGLLISAGLDVS